MDPQLTPRRWRLRLVIPAACAVAAAAGLVLAQPAPETTPTTTPSPTAAPAENPTLPTGPDSPTVISNPPPADEDQTPEAATNKPEAPKPVVDAKPVAPPKPLRSPAAVLRALDKVTAETILFEAPIGQRVRYKSLVFTVKACETTNPSDPSPQPAVYLIVESQPLPADGRAPPPAKEVYHGWMYANSPGLHPLEHPIYDAWLVACNAVVPGT